jgi:prepilin-type N-terminal cleavage/methylation domain-containing protein
MAPSPRTSKSAFTLVEMLVSIAVLVLIMTFIAQMMNSVSLSTTLSDKHLDADAQARLVFDRMAMDIASMPLNNNLEYLFAKQGMKASPGGGAELNDKMFFFSNAPAFFSSSNAELFPSDSAIDPKSDIALIGYCINTGSNNTGNTSVTPPPYCLQRLSKGLTWDQAYPSQGAPGGPMFLTFPPLSSGSNTWTPYPQSTLSGNSFTTAAIGAEPDYSGTDADFDAVANQVFRMEFCFQVRDLAPGANGGTVFSNFPVAVYTDTNSKSSVNQTSYETTDPPTKTGNNLPYIGDRWYNMQDNRAFEYTGQTTVYSSGGSTTYETWSPIGLSDVTAIVATIAVIDSNSRKVLSQEQLSDAASYLPKFDNGKEPPSTPSGSPELPATAWQEALDDQQIRFAGQAGIPQAVVGQIRIYQHFFYLNQ